MKNVSIIVPVYNTEKFLERCMDSLMNQTLKGIEIVVVDDGSTDGSGKILQKYAKEYKESIKLFSKKNGGQASARNLALTHCEGKYIGFLDSDDYVKPDMFEKLFYKAESGKLDYVGCGYTDFTYQDGTAVILSEYVGQKVCTTTREMYRDSLVSPFINFYKSTIIKESGCFFPEGVIYEDTAFFVNLLPYIKTIGYIEEPLAFRLRRRNSTTTLTNPDKIAQIFPVIGIIVDFYKKNGWMESYRNEVEYFCIRILLCSSLERISRVNVFSERQKLVEKTWKVIRNYFGSYSKNPYFKNTKKDIYMKYSNKVIVSVVCELIHLTGKGKGQYV